MKIKGMVEKMINLSQIKTEPVGDDLMRSEKMKPYIDLHVALAKEKGVEAALSLVVNLELRDRYLWRVASALQWAFADFDSGTARIDWDAMSEEERAQVTKMLDLRLIQLSYLISELYGASEADRQLSQARLVVQD